MISGQEPPPTERGHDDLLDQEVLLIEEGPPGLARGLGKFLPRAEVSEVRPVRKEDGSQIGVIEPIGKVGGARTELLRWLLNPGRQSINVPYAREFAVSDMAGRTLLELGNHGRDLLVRNAAGEVGAVQNTSRSGGRELTLSFHDPPRRTRWRWHWGPELASLNARPQEYAAEWEIVRDSPIARVANPGSDTGGISRLQFVAAVEEPLRTVIIGFACSLVYRNWLSIPPRVSERT